MPASPSEEHTGRGGSVPGSASSILMFGDLPMPQAVRSLSLNTSQSELKVFADRLHSFDMRKAGRILTTIEIPGGSTWSYWIRYGDGQLPIYDDRDNMEYTKTLGEQHDVDSRTLKTLETFDGNLHIIFPLGTLKEQYPPSPGLEVVTYYVVYVLDLDQFWAIFSYDLEGGYEDLFPVFEYDGPKDPRRRVHDYKRKSHFPGTELVASIAILHGLFSNNVRLEIKDTEDFFIRAVIHYEGRSLATVGDRVVDVGKRTEDGDYVEVDVGPGLPFREIEAI